MKLLRSPAVRKRYGDISDPTLWRWTKDGRIPKPKYINGQRVWEESELDEADETLIQDSAA